MTIKFIYRKNCQAWDENDQAVDSSYHLPGDPYFPDLPAAGMLILIGDSKPEEDPTKDLEDMEQEPMEDPEKDPEVIE